MQLKDVQYKNEFDHIFLMLETEEDASYKRKMILYNDIEGILPCKRIYQGEKPYLSYDISGKTTLLKKYEETIMKFEDIEELLFSVIYTVKKIREYLLDSQNICFDPGYIFFDIETNKLFLLYDPDSTYKRSLQYKDLSEFLLDKVDHREERAVKIAYQFYRLSKEEFFTLEIFQGLIEKERIVDVSERKVEEKESLSQKDDEIENIIINQNIDLNKNRQREWWEDDGLSKNRKKKGIFGFFSNRKKRKEEQDEEEIRKAEKITIDEYFGDEIGTETVFFDDNFRLKWKEGNFSKEFELTGFPVKIGKMKYENDMVIEDSTISRIHAKFEERKGKIYLQDLNSTNGTIVNGKALRAGEEVEIMREDEIQFGKIVVNVV